MPVPSRLAPVAVAIALGASACSQYTSTAGPEHCGAINDVWRVQDGVFVEAIEATSGEVCHRFRPNPDNCVNLCF